MRKLFGISLLFLASSLWASTTFTAHLINFTATPANAFVKIKVINCTGILRVSGGVVANDYVNGFEVFPDATGLVSVNIPTKAEITCGATSNASSYTFDVWQGNSAGTISRKKLFGQSYDVTGAFVLETATPLATDPVAPTALSVLLNPTAAQSITNFAGTKLSIIGALTSSMATVTFSATPTFDANLGNSFKITLTNNVTSSTLSNAVAGQELAFLICQDGTGGRTFVPPANVQQWSTIPSGPNNCAIQMYQYDGTNAYPDLMPSLTGDATTSFGSPTVTLATSGISAGDYGTATFDTKGRATSGFTSVYRVTADFTLAANTSLQLITGLHMALPVSKAVNLPFSCDLLYSQATAAVPISFGIQDTAVAPTSLMVKANVDTSATAFTAANVPALNTTTQTTVVTATPSAIATVWNVKIAGFVEQPSNATPTFIDIMASQSNSADLLTIKRGSGCRIGL